MRREVGGGARAGEGKEGRRTAFQVRVFLFTGIPSLSVLRSSDPFFVFARLFSSSFLKSTHTNLSYVCSGGIRVIPLNR